MPHLPPDIHYVLDSAMQLGEITKSDLSYFISKTDLDVISIFDNNSNPIEILKDEYKKWYKNCIDIEKSTLFYYFLKNSEFELEFHCQQLAKAMVELKAFKKVNFNNAKFSLNYCKTIYKSLDIKKYDDTNYVTILDDSENSDDKLKFIELNIKHSINYFDLYKKTLVKLKNNVNFSLDNCMLYLNNYQENKTLTPPFIDLEALAELQKKSKIQNKETENKMKQLIKKSLKTLTSFIGKDNVNSFFNADGFIVEGKLFNFEIKKRKEQSMLNQHSLNQGHIPYILNVLDKNNEFLCNLCIVFKECPVLDQVLSIYMMIKAKQEKEILNIANIMSKSDLFYKNKHMIKIFNLDLNKNDFETTQINLFPNNMLEVLKDKVKKEQLKSQQTLNIAKKIKEQLQYTLFKNNSEMYNFIFCTGLCWDEMKDHHAIGITNNQLDYLVLN